MSGAPLKLFVRPERRFVAEGRPTELLVLVRLMPAGTAVGDERVPLRLAIVLDPAASDAVRDAQRAAVAALEALLNPADQVALVSAGEVARVLRPMARVAPGDLGRALDAWVGEPAGGLYPAWLCGALQVAEGWDADAIGRVVLVSAGRSPLGPEPRESVFRGIRGTWRRGIGTSTIGIGAHVDEDLLVPIATEAGGGAYLAERPDEAQECLRREVETCQSMWTEASTLRFDTERSDVVELLNGLPWVGTNKVALPPLWEGSALQVVARIRISPTDAGEDMVPLTLRLKALNLAGTEALVFRKSLRLHVVAPGLADGMEPDVSVQAQAARLQLARTYRRCLDKLDAGELDAVRNLLDFAVAQFRSLSGQQGGTLLTRELHTAVRLREAASGPERAAECRRLLRYSAFWLSRAELAE
jgi:Ca-activated chloride channel family protein